MTKEIVKKEEMALSTEITDLWKPQAVTASDIIIPKVMVMQGLSELVTEGKAMFGDFKDSLTEATLGGVNAPFEFIPFKLEKLLYVTQRKAGTQDKFKMKEVIPLDAESEKLAWTDFEGDFEIKRTQVYNFYVINPKDTSIPYIIPFKGMSLRNGKVLNTLAFVKSFIDGSFPPANHYTLNGTKTTNDKGTFVVIDAKKGDKSTNAEIQAAALWMKTLDAGGAKAHEETETFAQADTQF